MLSEHPGTEERRSARLEIGHPDKDQGGEREVAVRHKVGDDGLGAVKQRCEQGPGWLTCFPGARSNQGGQGPKGNLPEGVAESGQPAQKECQAGLQERSTVAGRLVYVHCAGERALDRYQIW